MHKEYAPLDKCMKDTVCTGMEFLELLVKEQRLAAEVKPRGIKYESCKKYYTLLSECHGVFSLQVYSV